MTANLQRSSEAPQGRMLIHPLAWVAWLASALVALSTTRHPLYLLIPLTCIGLVLREVRAQAYAPSLPISPLRFALIVVGFSALFNALTAHFGATVLFSLPSWLPLFGGPFTLEALLYGALGGLVLTGFFMAFLVLYVALPTQALIRLIPRAFYPVGVVVSVAVAFVPTTFVQFQQIREAQLMRGHRVRGLRDWLPLLMPLLVGALERALQLAEAMTARGFGSIQASAGPGRGQRSLNLLLLSGLAFVLIGLIVRLVWGERVLSLGLLAAGGVLLLGALWRQGRGIKRSVYRPQRWAPRDGFVLAGVGIVLAGYLALPLLGLASLAYSPYPKVSLPLVAPLVILTGLGLAVPALLLWQSRRSRQGEQA